MSSSASFRLGRRWLHPEDVTSWWCCTSSYGCVGRYVSGSCGCMYCRDGLRLVGRQNSTCGRLSSSSRCCCGLPRLPSRLAWQQPSRACVSPQHFPKIARRFLRSSGHVYKCPWSAALAGRVLWTPPQVRRRAGLWRCGRRPCGAHVRASADGVGSAGRRPMAALYAPVPRCWGSCPATGCRECVAGNGGGNCSVSSPGRHMWSTLRLSTEVCWGHRLCTPASWCSLSSSCLTTPSCRAWTWHRRLWRSSSWSRARGKGWSWWWTPGNGTCQLYGVREGRCECSGEIQCLGPSPQSSSGWWWGQTRGKMYILLINREWVHYREISDCGLYVARSIQRPKSEISL